MITPIQHYLASIILQRKTSFVTSFTVSKWLKSTNPFQEGSNRQETWPFAFANPFKFCLYRFLNKIQSQEGWLMFGMDSKLKFGDQLKSIRTVKKNGVSITRIEL